MTSRSCIQPPGEGTTDLLYVAMRYHAQSARLNRRCLTLRNQPSSRAFLLAVIRYSLDDVTHFIRSTRTDIAREDYASRTIFERNRRTKFEPGFVQTASDRLVERFLQHHTSIAAFQNRQKSWAVLQAV